MKGSNIISGVHCLRQAFEFFADCQRTNPGTKGEKLLAVYNCLQSKNIMDRK